VSELIITDYDVYYDCTTTLSELALERSCYIKNVVLFEGNSILLLSERSESSGG